MSKFPKITGKKPRRHGRHKRRCSDNKTFAWASVRWEHVGSGRGRTVLVLNDGDKPASNTNIRNPTYWAYSKHNKWIVFIQISNNFTRKKTSRNSEKKKSQLLLLFTFRSPLTSLKMAANMKQSSDDSSYHVTLRMRRSAYYEWIPENSSAKFPLLGHFHYVLVG